MGFAKLKYMPYINFYLDNMDLKKNEVHILYWNRDLQQEKTMDYSDCILHEFRCYQEDDVSKFLKIKSFIKYRKYAKQLIQKEKFDFLIALHSMPAILMSNILIEQYREKYIFDYRDSTYERFAPYKKLIGKIVCNSKYTFVQCGIFGTGSCLWCFDRSAALQLEKQNGSEGVSHRNLDTEIYFHYRNRIYGIWIFEPDTRCPE